MNPNEDELSAGEKIKQPEEKNVKQTEEETTESKPKTCCISSKNILILSIMISILLLILILALCLTLIKKDKKTEDTEKDPKIVSEDPNEKYIIGTYYSQKDVPLKLFNPARIGLEDQNYAIEEISTNKTRRLYEQKHVDGVIIPEDTGIIKIKIIFDLPLTSLDFMFEGCSNLVKISLSYLKSPNITSMIYTFTGCTSLETVDFTSFSSENIEKMDFLFGGCSNLVNIKGFEDLNTTNLQKTAGMFLECKNLISVNLSAFQLDNISETDGMFIDNPSLEIIDIGNTSQINGIFSSEEKFNVKIITSSIEVNTSGLSGIFSIISREASRLLNCSLRNWTDFLTQYANFGLLYELVPENFTEILNHYETYYLGKNLYDELMKVKYIDCKAIINSTYSFSSILDHFITLNYSECERYKRLFIDFLNEHEKCNECEEEEGKWMYCKSCSKGYYLPKGIDYTLTRCKRCDEGCVECISDGETDKSICIKCEDNNNIEYELNNGNRNDYKLYNGKCYKKCEIGENEKCHSCNEQNGKYNECLTCNDGYYFDINYDKGKCRKIEDDKCLQAIKEYNSVNCVQCIEGYIAHDGQCEKGCELGENGNTCASCNPNYEFKDSCLSCHPGYYLLTLENKAICSNCHEDSLDKNCTECYRNSEEIICTSCNSFTFLADGKCINSCTENCLNCAYENENEKLLCNQCKNDYFLKEYGEGRICEKCPENCTSCLNKNNCTGCLEEYKLIDGVCEKYCNIGSDSSCVSCDFDEKNKCQECNPGYYLPNNISIYSSTCNYCGPHCLSCYGDENYPICTQCEEGFYVSNYGFCNYCGSDRIKKCHQENIYITIDECYPDYILFNNSCIDKCNSSNYFSKCIECNDDPDKLHECKTCKEGYYLPDNLYNIYCEYCPENCKSCEGPDYDPICTECYGDYILSGGKCLNHCKIGNDELCNNCSNVPGKIDRCEECNDGYYLANDNDQKQCTKCPNNCQRCIDVNNTADCTECDTGYYLAQNEINVFNYFYNPTFYHECLKCNITGCSEYKHDSNTCICIKCDSTESERIRNGNKNNEYLSCYGQCSIGPLDKCKTCGDIIGECGTCNDGYILNSNKKCIPNFHLFAKYKTTKNGESVKLLYNNYILSMTINGTSFNKPGIYRTFSLPGEHLVYIKFSSDIYFPHLFQSITQVTYIEFLPKAKELYIGLMNDCFKGCSNLEFINLSNLNLKNNGCFMNFFQYDIKLKEVIFPKESFSNVNYYYNMFYGCESLTSVDMSNVVNTNGGTYHHMFYGCKNLKYINLRGFNKNNPGGPKNNMFDYVPKDAKIIIHRNFYDTISGQLTSFTNKTII